MCMWVFFSLIYEVLWASKLKSGVLVFPILLFFKANLFHKQVYNLNSVCDLLWNFNYIYTMQTGWAIFTWFWSEGFGTVEWSLVVEEEHLGSISNSGTNKHNPE